MFAHTLAGRYTDKLNLAFAASGAACVMKACSASQVNSVKGQPALATRCHHAVTCLPSLVTVYLKGAIIVLTTRPILLTNQ